MGLPLPMSGYRLEVTWQRDLKTEKVTLTNKLAIAYKSFECLR